MRFRTQFVEIFEHEHKVVFHKSSDVPGILFGGEVDGTVFFLETRLQVTRSHKVRQAHKVSFVMNGMPLNRIVQNVTVPRFVIFVVLVRSERVIQR